MNFSQRSIEIVAKTIYGEARGEYYSEKGGLPALMAIANVIRNRFSQSGEKMVENICVKPKQFSCWNANDPNLTAIESIPKKDPVYKLCVQTAEKVLAGEWPDITKGATHYYSDTLPKAPYWASGKTPTIKIGHHAFFRL